MHKTLADAISDEVDARLTALWDAIKALPTTAFSTTNEALAAMVKVGHDAEAVQALRKVREFLLERK